MHVQLRTLVVSVTLALAVLPAHAQETGTAAAFGHSAHGTAFDEGPRQRPWRMEGIGTTHFPITTSVPEVQEWFDQGNTLLHNFWWYEAERSFRWCLKLDPDCAMAYWGLARSVDIMEPSDRRKTFLREAVARMDQVTDRERLYIEAFARAFLPEFAEKADEAGFDPRTFTRLAQDLELIVLAYPDDDEAKALFALASLFNETRYGNEAVIREILARNPRHPGAHHYRIHTWDGKEGDVALESCEIYGRLASASGHANHMPGHIYSGIGLWHEGAIWMDSATRVEKTYMEQRMTLPYHNWNYAHNRNYLCFIQEQLGLPSLAIDGARQLLLAPLDPKYNTREGYYTVYAEGREALVRALVKYERWDEILDGAIPWGAGPADQAARAYCEALAYLARGDVASAADRRAQIARAKTQVRDIPPGPPGFEPPDLLGRMLDEVAGRIELARGNAVAGVDLLARAARTQAESYREENDPPAYPHLIYNVLGEVHLDRQSPGMAVACFEAALAVCPNDAFALSGLARAQHALGDSVAAAEAYGRLKFVWSDAEPGLRWMESVEALGLVADPIDDGPRPQRSYRAQTLDHLGPQAWRPYAAPELDALDPHGTRVTLEEYRGSNVLLVFYLGDSCVHCIEQLHAIGERANQFSMRDVELLAISSDSVERNAASLKLGELPFRLLSDADHANARRFHSYDEFEEMELHSTILIDADGRIRWARSGGDPFMDFDFLLDEIDRVNDAADLAAGEILSRSAVPEGELTD